jgi:hypothetical protein
VADDLARIVPDDERPQDSVEPAPRDPERADDNGQEPPYQSRFQLMFGVLLGVALAAIAATVIVLASSSSNSQNDPSAATWAPWHPTAPNGLDAVKQIATHVGERYTLPSGNQMVAIRGGDLELAQLPITVAVQDQGRVKLFEKNGVLYNMCGLGKNCSIAEGKPSVARSLVTRREALELALYTFRYIKNVDQVVVILPPPPKEKPSFAMFYQRADVGASLRRPLSATLPGRPPVPPRVPQATQAAINQLTFPNLFSYVPREGGDAHVYLVLSRPK